MQSELFVSDMAAYISHLGPKRIADATVHIVEEGEYHGLFHQDFSWASRRRHLACILCPSNML